MNFGKGKNPGTGMNIERAKELLNSVIDHISIAKTCTETIKCLIKLGFTDEELCGEFGFIHQDVDWAEKELDEEDGEQEE